MAAEKKEPYWSALERPALSPVAIAASLLRHLIPVVGTIGLGWSVTQFALLSVFNIAFSIACIGMVGVGVSMLQTPAKPGRSLWQRIEPWVSFFLVGAFLTVMLTTLFGWVIVVMAPEGGALFADRRLWLGAGAMVLAALPPLWAQARADARSKLAEEQRKARDQPRAGVLIFTGIIIFVCSGYAASWFGTWGLYPLMFVITALFVLSDLRPDLMRELTRPEGQLSEKQKAWKKMIDRL